VLIRKDKPNDEGNHTRPADVPENHGCLPGADRARHPRRAVAGRRTRLAIKLGSDGTEETGDDYRRVIKAGLGRMHDVMAGYVERGDVPGIVTLVSRRGEVHVDANRRLKRLSKSLFEF